jgi:hypothetical protein
VISGRSISAGEPVARTCTVPRAAIERFGASDPQSSLAVLKKCFYRAISEMTSGHSDLNRVKRPSAGVSLQAIKPSLSSAPDPTRSVFDQSIDNRFPRIVRSIQSKFRAGSLLY